MKKVFIALLLVLALTFSLVACGEKEDTAGADLFKMYLITMDRTDGHWKKVDAGCLDAVAEIGADKIEYVWDAPQDGKDDNQQVECINNAVAAGADLILLAAHDANAQTGAIEAAIAEGVKFIFVDSPADISNDAIIQTIKTNNEAAGKTAGEALLAALKEKGIEEGKIGITSPDKGTASTDARVAGFTSAFAGTAFEILEPQYCDGGKAEVAQEKANDFITNGVVGLFGANEGCAVGIANAIGEAGGEILGVGFDTSETVLTAVENGILIGTMAQEPYKMGYMGIKNGYDYLANGTAPANKDEDSGATLVDASKVADYK
jgi:ABC-type sugar transport system, periplasmic component